MMECETKVKKWGNSFGIVLPKNFIRDNSISPEDKVRVIVTKIGKKGTAEKLWGKLPQWKTPSEELERLADKELDFD